MGGVGYIFYACIFFPGCQMCMYVFFKNMSSCILNKSDACIFFQTFLFAWIFFLFFPHPPYHFSNGPSLTSQGYSKLHDRAHLPIYNGYCISYLNAPLPQWIRMQDSNRSSLEHNIDSNGLLSSSKPIPTQGILC
jgi:hypothetical protein